MASINARCGESSPERRESSLPTQLRWLPTHRTGILPTATCPDPRSPLVGTIRSSFFSRPWATSIFNFLHLLDYENNCFKANKNRKRTTLEADLMLIWRVVQTDVLHDILDGNCHYSIRVTGPWGGRRNFQPYLLPIIFEVYTCLRVYTLILRTLFLR